MTRAVFQLRASSLGELDRWKRCADGNLSAWLRGLANEECDRLEAAGRDQVVLVQERLAVVQAAFPQKSFRPDPK